MALFFVLLIVVLEVSNIGSQSLVVLLLATLKLQAQQLENIETLETKIGKGFWKKKMICKNDSCYVSGSCEYFFADHFENDIKNGDSVVTSFFINRIARARDYQTNRYEWMQSSCPDWIRILAEKRDGQFDVNYLHKTVNCTMRMLVKGETFSIEGECLDADRYKVVYVRVKPPRKVRKRIAR